MHVRLHSESRIHEDIDTSRGRLTPRRHVLVQAVVTTQLCHHTCQLPQRQRTSVPKHPPLVAASRPQLQPGLTAVKCYIPQAANGTLLLRSLPALRSTTKSDRNMGVRAGRWLTHAYSCIHMHKHRHGCLVLQWSTVVYAKLATQEGF